MDGGVVVQHFLMSSSTDEVPLSKAPEPPPAPRELRAVARVAGLGWLASAYWHRPTSGEELCTSLLQGTSSVSWACLEGGPEEPRSQ